MGKRAGTVEFGHLCTVCGWRYLTGHCTAWYCGGNVARFERWKLELGTRLVYLNAAPRVGDRSTWLGTLLLMEAHRRGCYVKSQSPRAEWLDAAYCLDAPDEMPAGGCYGMEFEDLEDECLPCQIVVNREGE